VGFDDARGAEVQIYIYSRETATNMRTMKYTIHDTIAIERTKHEREHVWRVSGHVRVRHARNETRLHVRGKRAVLAPHTLKLKFK
jgi:hypothetical protein